jgi:hypothetical protein
MRQRAALVVVAAAVVVGTALAWGLPGTPAPAQQQAAGAQWEYKFLGNLSEEECNRLGAEGWELAVARAGGGGGSNALIFKRPRR